MSSFQRENTRKYTWELEIIIPIIIYTFPCGFSQLLPLHLYIFERLLAQTLTTPILSVKWDFGATRSIGRSHSLVDATGLNCGIRKATKDKASRSQLVAGAWRAQVHGVDWAWRVFCYLCTPNLFSNGLILTWRVVERFFTEFFDFLFDNTSQCYLVFTFLLPAF